MLNSTYNLFLHAYVYMLNMLTISGSCEQTISWNKVILNLVILQVIIFLVTVDLTVTIDIVTSIPWWIVTLPIMIIAGMLWLYTIFLIRSVNSHKDFA